MGHRNVEDQILRQRQTNWTAACIALAPDKQWHIGIGANGIAKQVAL